MGLSLRDISSKLREPDTLITAKDAIPPRGFRAAAVIIPLVQRDDKVNVIFNKRAKNLQTHAGQVGFPGGRRDLTDPSLCYTAERELQEELGIDPKRHDVLCRLAPRLVVSYYEVTPFVSVIDSSAEIYPDPAEVQYAFEVPLDHFMVSGTETATDREIFGKRRIFYAWEWKDEVVWGATGRFVADFIRALGASHVEP